MHTEKAEVNLSAEMSLGIDIGKMKQIEKTIVQNI